MIETIFGSIDPGSILKFGVIGLGFLLAFLSYNLLRKEQKRELPRKILLNSILIFMVFSVIICSIGLFSEFLKRKIDKVGVKAIDHKYVLAGTVTDEQTEQSISQAEITLVGRNEQYFTEENGNFKIELKDTIKSIRIRVSKKYFQPFDKTYDLPNENIIIPLTKISHE